MKTQPNFGPLYPTFGSVMEGRSFVGDTSGWYRFGFGGQEKDDEIYGKGKTYSAEFWEYDARVGRRWNVDPKTYVQHSPYLAFNNNPIFFIDPKGLEGENSGGKTGFISKVLDKLAQKRFDKKIKQNYGNEFEKQLRKYAGLTTEPSREQYDEALQATHDYFYAKNSDKWWLQRLGGDFTSSTKIADVTYHDGFGRYDGSGPNRSFDGQTEVRKRGRLSQERRITSGETDVINLPGISMPGMNIPSGLPAHSQVRVDGDFDSNADQLFMSYDDGTRSDIWNSGMITHTLGTTNVILTKTTTTEIKSNLKVQIHTVLAPPSLGFTGSPDVFIFRVNIIAPIPQPIKN